MYIVTYNVEDVIRFGIREELEDAEQLCDEWIEYGTSQPVIKTDNKIELVEVDDIELTTILYDLYIDSEIEFDFSLDKKTIRKFYTEIAKSKMGEQMKWVNIYI